MVFTPKQNNFSFALEGDKLLRIDGKCIRKITRVFACVPRCTDEKLSYFHDKNTSCDIYGLICRVKTR